MKLDATDLRYVTSDEFRVLTAVEMGSKNHEIVPTVLIVRISGLRNGGVNKILGSLAKRSLVSRVQNARCAYSFVAGDESIDVVEDDGYRLTYGGYDYLAMRAMSKRDSVYSVGNQIGVGKESDIYIVADNQGQELVLKLHRLGRISFRAIKQKRDYMGKRKSASWMYMSRLAAEKEYAFMKVLYEHQFPVPRPVDQARHCILMEFIDAYPLRQVSDLPSPGALYSELMDLIVRFARAGLIHGDFNEFNILIRRETGEPIVIDFPQMVSTSHTNAEWYFNRDVECIRRFFKRRFRYESSIYPRFRSIKNETSGDGSGAFHLDLVVAASGYDKGEQKVLEEYMDTIQLEKSRKEPDGADDDEEDTEDTSDADEDADEDEEFSEEDDVGEEDENGGNELAEADDLESEHELHMHDNTLSREEPHDGLRMDASPNPGDGIPSETDEGVPLSPIRHLSRSRSPPASRHTSRSRSGSPSSLVERAAALSLSNATPRPTSSKDVSEKVLSEVTKQRAHQQRKYHSKKGAQKMGGRPKGSKRKMDGRIKVDGGGFWD
ncbi:Serine/threonine-protein kinase rio2 [Grifola frondosa]|uniref:Serine/threonine-protein kinase RIO2 n=1 Tax=Grifola frondosa TaxID=5627 RepID=A0A1C7MQK7_GRIFR|nr:Serine/threonine-protein kinase rio2 [Grifola frondosa]